MSAATDVDPRWQDRLRDAGLRVTRPRLVILDLLLELGAHHTAEELNSLLTKRGTPLTRGTFYNVLDDLVVAGLAIRADRGPGTAIYELNQGWHHHFVCSSCAAVIDVPCAATDEPCLQLELPGASVEQAQIIFRGVCSDCREKQ